MSQSHRATTLLKKRNTSRVSSKTVVDVVAGDAHKGSLSSKRVVYVYERRLACALRLKSRSAYSEYDDVVTTLVSNTPRQEELACRKFVGIDCHTYKGDATQNEAAVVAVGSCGGIGV